MTDGHTGSARPVWRVPEGQEHDFRPGVGLVLLRRDGQVWAGQRAPGPHDRAGHPPLVGGWQWPQGGIEPGESPEQALRREMTEEIGTSDFRILGWTPWLAYPFPEEIRGQIWGGAYQGQRHLWFAATLNPGARIRVDGEHPEFSRWAWMKADDVQHKVVAFKKPVYRRICTLFRPLFAGMDCLKI